MIKYKIISKMLGYPHNKKFKYVTAEVYVKKTLICIFPAYFMINLDNINFNLLEERVMKAIMSNVHKLIDTHSMYYSNKLYSI